jgi:hypothetical protein
VNEYVTQWAGRKNSLATRLKPHLRNWSRSNIGMVELPPTRQTQYGPISQSLGYDPVRDYDWGNCGTPTRVGTEAEIQDFTAEAHAHGQRVTGDFVDRQYGGNPPYPELDAQGRKNMSLFYKGAAFFDGPRDTQFDPELVPDDGMLPRYQHSKPEGWLLREKCKADAAMMVALGLDGGRQDEAKSMWEGALHALFAARPGEWNVAEYYTGDTEKLDRFWRTFKVPVIDFPYHYACRDVANGASFRRLVGSAYADRNPDGAYRYVESLDTDGPNGIINNKLWFYLHGMTSPCKVFRIFAGDFEGYDLGRPILNYAWVSHLALGAQVYTVQEDDLLCWYRDGNGGQYGRTAGVLCGFSRDPIATQWRWTPTPFGPNRQIHNYAISGGDDTWTNQDGWAYLPFPPNSRGSAQNGTAWSVAGLDGPIILPALPHNLTA